jgi:hypothetical protein
MNRIADPDRPRQRNPNVSFRRSLGFLTLLVLPILAACSGPDDTATATMTTAPSTQTAVAATPSPTLTPPAPSTSTAEPSPTVPASTATPTDTQPPATPPPAATQAPVQATAPAPTPWVPVDNRPVDQRVTLPDITAHYDLHITELDLESGYVRASEVVTIQAFHGEPPGVVYFQALPAAYGFFTLLGMTLDGQPYTPEVRNDGFTLVLTLPPDVTAPVEIGFEFELRCDDTADGWGYTSLDGGVLRLGFWYPIISTDHGFVDTFDPFYARTASFTARLDIEPGIDFAHTGEITAAETLPDGRTRYSLAAEQVRDFDFVISRAFTRASATSASGVNVEYYWRAGEVPDRRAEVLEWTVYAVDRLSELIGPYPYPSLRIADAGPNMPAGIEFANVIYVQVNYAALDRLIYHEVAHQWLYGIIGTRTLLDGWIDEGGAEFFERGLGTDFTEVPPVPEGGFLWPLDSTWLEIPYVWPDWYYAIYEQGGRLYYDVLAALGWDAFWAAMRELYEQYAFEIVTAWDLLHIWQAHSPVDLRPLFDQYFRYPWIGQLPEPGVTTHQGWVPINP